MATITSWRERRRVAQRRTTPLRTIASGLIQIARAAFAEPYQLAVERHAVGLKRLPRELGLNAEHLAQHPSQQKGAKDATKASTAVEQTLFD